MEQKEQAVVQLIRQIIKKDKHLKSLGPTKRPIILNKLRQTGYALTMLDLTKIINTHFKN